MSLLDVGPKPGGPTHPPKPPPPPPPPPPPELHLIGALLPRPSGPPRPLPLPQPKTLRIGKPPRLPHRVRRARLLNTLGRYAIAWGVVGVGCYWITLGDTALGLALIAIAGFISGPHTTKNVRRLSALPRMGGDGLSPPGSPGRA